MRDELKMEERAAKRDTLEAAKFAVKQERSAAKSHHASNAVSDKHSREEEREKKLQDKMNLMKVSQESKKRARVEIEARRAKIAQEYETKAQANQQARLRRQETLTEIKNAKINLAIAAKKQEKKDAAQARAERESLRMAKEGKHSAIVEANKARLIERKEAKQKQSNERLIQKNEALAVKRGLNEAHQEELRKAAAKRKKARAEAREITEREWYKIDNAGIIFVPARNRNWTNQFRFAAVLKEKVRPEILQQAVNDLYKRFPTMMVYLKGGMFWNYFEGAAHPPVITEEQYYPCRPFDVQSRSYLMRVMYSEYRIIVEFFHGITDGHGGIVYLMSLLRRYFELCGANIPVDDYALDYRDLPSDDEKEDAFMRYGQDGIQKKWSEKASVQLKKLRAERGNYYITHAVIQVPSLKAKAREYGATVSEYLASCLMWTLRNQYISQRTKSSENPLRLCVPVDLRRLKPSNTLRNFILMYNIEHYPETPATFDEIVSDVKSQFACITAEYVQQFINKNVSTEANWFVRILPRPIKSLGLNVAYSMFALNQSAMSFSNLGIVPVQEDIRARIERLEFVLGPGKTRGFKASCLTVGDELILSFGSDCLNHNVESAFLRFLTEQGIAVTVDTNRRECNE